MANETRLKLYKALDNAGFDVGGYDEFDRRMNNASDRQSFHKAVSNAGYDIGDFESFDKKIAPSKYKLKINGTETAVSEKQYRDFVSKHPGKTSAQTPSVYQKAKAKTQMPATPWSYEAAKEKLKATPSNGQISAYDLSRPEMNQSDILSGQALMNAVDKRREAVANIPDRVTGDYAMEQMRKRQPIAKTGTPADQYVVKTQGQWEDELSKSVDELVNEPIANDVDKAIAQADADYLNTLRANQQIGVPSEAAPLWGLMTEGAANRQRDPEKVLSGLVENAQQRYQEYFSQPETLEKIKRQADTMGLTPDDYVNKVVLPQIEGRMKEQFEKTQIARNMPSGHVEYLLRGLGDSIVGTLASQLGTTKSQRVYSQMGDEEFRRQRGGGFMSGVEDAARMGVSLAADVPVLKGFGTVAGLSTKGIAGTKYGGKILGDLGLRSAAQYANASVAQRALMNIPSSMLSGAINLGLYEGTSNVVNNISVGEDTSLGNSLKLFAEGFEHGAVTGGVLGMFGAATRGLGSNIGIKAGDTGMTKALHGAEKALYEAGALGVEGMGFHTADQINKFLSGEETDKDFGEFVTGTLDGAVMAGMLKLTSAHNAEKAIRGIGSGKAVTQFRDGLTRFLSAETSDLRLTDVDRKALSFLGDIDQVMKNVRTADDAAGIYKEVMENPKVPFSTKQKFSAMTVGTMSASKPIWNSLSLLEDNTIETVKRVVDEQGNVHEQVIDRFEFNDKDDYKAKLQELNDERQNQIMRNGYALHTQMLVQQMPGLREKVLEKFGYSPELGDDNPANQRVIESVSRGGEAEQAFNDAMRELASQGVKIEDPLLKSFAQEYGMSEDGVLKVINKDFRDYTPEEAQMMKDFSDRVWNDLYPANEAHPTQSIERGQMLADQAEIGQVVNTGAVQQLSEKYGAAKQAYDAYLDSLSINPDELSRMSYPEQIDYIMKNFGDERAKDAILPLWDAELQNRGFFERLQQRTEEAADSVVSEMEFKGTVDGNKDEGVVYTIRDIDGNEYTLKGGDAVFTEDGHIDPKKSSQLIIALDAEGHPVSLGASADLVLAAKETKDERRARMLEEIQSKTTEEYLANGGLGDIVGQKLNVDPSKVQQEESAQPPLKQDNGAQAAVEAGGANTGADEAAAATPSEVAETQQPTQQETPTPPSAAENGIPLAKNGRTKEYHLVEPDVAIDDILQRDNSKVSWNNDPEKIADSYLKAARKSLDELDKKNKSLAKRAKEEDFDPDELDDITNGTENTDMGKYFAKRAEVEEKVNYYNNLKARWNERRAVVEPQPSAEPTIEEDASVRDAIVKEKSTLKSKWNALHKLYDGTAADDGEILDETRPLDINELVAMNMPRGIAWSSYVTDGTHEVRGLSEELGFDKNRRIGKDTNTSGFNTFLAKKGTGISIDEAVHRIWESNENQLPNGEKRFEDTEIRNAVIDMFLSAERPSDITNYVVNNRSRLANERLEQERRHEEEMQQQEKEGGNEIAEERTERDEYLEPRNDREKEIVSDVEKKLAEDIKEAEDEVRKAKSALEKARAKESDKATDFYSDDEAFREEGQIFDSKDMPTDRSQEGVDRRTEAERERLMEAEAKLENLQSEAEHDSRVRGALDNERRQTEIGAATEPQPTVNEEGKSAGSIQSDMPFAPAENDYVPFQKVEESDKKNADTKPFFDMISDVFKNGYKNVKEKYKRLRFNLGVTPSFMKKTGIIGDYFEVSFKNLKEHFDKDADHLMNQETWNELPNAIQHPFLITRYNGEKNKFRLYTNLKFGDKYVTVGVDVKRINKGKGVPMIEVNAIKTVFAKGTRVGDNEEVIVYDEKITPEQEALLRGRNFREYPTIQELSESKDMENSNTLQENQQKVAKINTSDPIEAINQAANSFRESRLTKMEKTIRDGVIKLMKKAGIDVSTDWEEGQKILDEHNERVKAQKDSSPIFTSNAQRAVEGIKQEKATPEQWLKMIEKNGGLKAGEDKWMGLSDWLKGQDKKSLTKQEVLDFIRENQIQVEETNYKEYINVDDNPQMKEFRTEFDDIVRKLEDEKAAVEQEANAFNDEMYQKYGEGWANDPDRLSEEDSKRNDEMIERWNKLNDEDLQELAFREMVEKYGDDFEMAFEYNYGNGKLEPQMDMYGDNISDAAKHFLQFEDQPINSTRLSYTTEGLQNKKEIALTVPTVESWNEGDEVHFGDAGQGRAVAWIRFGETTTNAKSHESATNILDELEAKYGTTTDYSKMSDEDAAKKAFANYLWRNDPDVEWMITKEIPGDVGNERAEKVVELFKKLIADNSKGERVLVIDEIQSKRHQEGREKGYKKELPPYTEDMLSVVLNEDSDWEIGEDLGNGNVRNLSYYPSKTMSREEAIAEFIRSHDRVQPGIPDAPFEKNWHELAMKRMLRYAAENGYDKVAWTKGEQQAERYSLSKAFDSVEREDNPSVKGRRFVFSGRNVENFVVDDEGKVIDSTINDSKGKNLSELVGKDMAVKLMALENGDIIEDGLRIGGEGMKGFYDQMLPRFMDKYGKKWGVKTGEVELPNVEEAGRKMWSVDVTPEMKESVMEGQPMFFKTKDGEAYGFVKDGKIYIDPRIATAETPIHEYTHLWGEAVRNSDPDKWKNIVDVLKNDENVKSVWEKVAKDYPELKEDDAIAEEVLAQFSGKRGAERLRAEAERISKEQGEEAGANFFTKIKNALTEFWRSVADKFGLPFKNAEEIADTVLKDLLEGKNPNEGREVTEEGDIKEQLIGEKGASSMDKAEESTLREEQEAYMGSDPMKAIEESARLFRGRETGKAAEEATTMFRFAKDKEDFDKLREEAVKSKGLVVRGLGDAEVKITNVSKHDFEGTGRQAIKSAKEWAKKNLIGEHNGTDSSGDEFTYHIDNDAIGKFLSQSSTGNSDNLGVHLAVLKELPSVIENSIEAEIHPDYLKDDVEGRSSNSAIGQDELVHRFYGAAEIDGKVYRVKTTILEKRGDDKSKPHDYKVTKVDIILDGGSSTSNAPRTSTLAGAKLLKGVEKSYDSGKKLLDESEKSTFFRKGSAEERQPVENRVVVEGHVTTLKSKLGEKVQMANSVDDIQNEKVRKKIENGEKVMGWYDERDGSVHLYMPNIPNSYEAEKTVWHETVGHKGMVELLGKDGYRRYMMKLWMDDKNTELGKYVKERLTTNGFDAYEAINEWYAEQVEKGVKNPYRDASMWQKVRESMSDGLRKAGYKMSPSIMDVKYMAWLSEQNKKGKVSESRKRKMLEKLMGEKYDTNNYGHLAYRSVGENDFDVSYRIQSGNGNTPIAALARDRYRNAIYDKFFPWDESHRDYMAAWRHAQEAIANGRNIPDHANALMLENEMDSKMKAMGDIYVRDLCMPAQEAMNECLAKLNVDKPEEAYMALNDYMYQKVGLQVNRQMYVRDWLRDQRKKGKDVDAVENEWYTLKADLKQKVDQGRITLRDYYTELDQWITDNVKRKKRVTDAQGNVHMVDAPFVADEHDASGLTAFAGSADGKSYDDGAILDRVMNMENQLGRDSAMNLWEKMRMITDFALETEYAGGIVNKESIDAARSQYDWYIPLRGFDETTADDMWTYLNRYGGKGMLGETLASRKGRSSKAEDPIATAFMMGEQAIRRAARNQVKQAALRFARQFSDPTDPNSLLTETDVWVKNESADPNNPDWVVQYPSIKPDAKPHEVAQSVAQFNQDMEALSQAGLAKRIKNAKTENIPYRFANDRNVSEHIIEAKVNGESKLIVFNDNPRAAQAINGQLKPKATSETLARVNRMMSQAYTSWAPTFIVRNAVRDAEFASSMLSVKEGWGYCGDFIKNYASLTLPGAGEKKKPEIFELFMKHRRGTLDENKPIERMFKEFIENGGVTGYTQENNIEKWHNDIVKSFKDAGKGKTKNYGKIAAKWFFESVEKMNESVENAARFATYMTSRQAGRTVIRSVADAKEVSVNFNRKGAGWKTSTFKDEKGQTNWNARTAAFTGQYLRDTSLFYNATVQGISNSLGNAQLATTKFITRFALPPFIVGALVPLLNQWVHNTFDPDDGSVSDNPYADLPEWDRRSNLCIYLSHNWFFKIPLSLEHKAFYGIGDIAAGATYDERLKSVDKPFFVDVADCLSTFSPVDYTDTEIGMKGATGRVAGLLVPAAAKPIVQAANNTSWTGKKIQKENKFNDEKTPEYLKAYEGKTSQMMVDAFDVWHQLWGGNEVERAGKRDNWATSIFGNTLTENVGEASPAKTQYWLEQQFGETGKMALSLGSGLYNVGKAAVTGGDILDDPDWNVKMIPGAKAFVSQGNEQQQFYRARTKYFHYQDQLKDTEYAFREYKKQAQTDPMKAVELQQFGKERRFKQYEVYKTTFQKGLDLLYKQIKAEKDPKKRKALKEQQNILMKNCVDALDNIE